MKTIIEQILADGNNMCESEKHYANKNIFLICISDAFEIMGVF